MHAYAARMSTHQTNNDCWVRALPFALLFVFAIVVEASAEGQGWNEEQ